MFLQIRIFHQVETDVIVEVNRKSYDFQKAKLEKTPFKWLFWMAEPIHISCPLLRELVNQWSPNE